MSSFMENRMDVPSRAIWACTAAVVSSTRVSERYQGVRFAAQALRNMPHYAVLPRLATPTTDQVAQTWDVTRRERHHFESYGTGRTCLGIISPHSPTVRGSNLTDSNQRHETERFKSRRGNRNMISGNNLGTITCSSGACRALRSDQGLVDTAS